MELILTILTESWQILLEAAPYMLFGFFAAGLLKALVPQDLVVRHLGKGNVASVLKAALFGIPLPLCSCGVIPAAIGLRRQGASRGASASFLVSVPETGVDSVAITWGLLGPLMAIVRPIAAFFTAILAGLLINRLPEEVAEPVDDSNGCSDGCCETGEITTSREPLLKRLAAGQAYAFGDLLGDIGKWLLIGILIAGLISALVPQSWIELYLGSEFLSLLIMLLVGIPLYICASASTPIAAALILKGLSPGAALVFLLAGPATNAAALTLVLRYFGRAATGVYLAAIAVASLMFGYLLNRVLGIAGIDLAVSATGLAEESAGELALVSALLLLALIAWNLRPRRKESCCG